MMCFAFRGSPDLLHQHTESVFFFVISSRLLPTHRRFSWISMITFIVFGVQFSVFHVFWKSFTSIELWFAMTFLRKHDDFVAKNSLK